MKIFDSKTYTWGGEKVNFVDENNVLVGYDMGQSCCESADWFIADAPTELNYETSVACKELPNPEDWRFDAEYFKEGAGNALDDGGVAIFRLVNGDSEKFLHLYNCHNGYYGHGFTMSIGGQGVREGVL